MELDYFEEVEKLVDKEIITISDSIALKVIGKDSIKNIINLLILYLHYLIHLLNL